MLEIITTGLINQIKWYKNGEEIIPKDDKIFIKSLSNNQFELNIPNTLLTDSGNYSVKISNDNESVESTGKIFIDSKPCFLSPLKDIQVFEGINYLFF